MVDEGWLATVLPLGEAVNVGGVWLVAVLVAPGRSTTNVGTAETRPTKSGNSRDSSR